MARKGAHTFVPAASTAITTAITTATRPAAGSGSRTSAGPAQARLTAGTASRLP
ncbi:hypothetical protein [Nonomuraea sp. NPDC001831]|uniref:hypothetical protein n=1 Tax=Nonomuraea sp. NPDC001831 TaxID=3364340 RepID=UPI0036CAC4A8